MMVVSKDYNSRVIDEWQNPIYLIPTMTTTTCTEYFDCFSKVIQEISARNADAAQRLPITEVKSDSVRGSHQKLIQAQSNIPHIIRYYKNFERQSDKEALECSIIKTSKSQRLQRALVRNRKGEVKKEVQKRQASRDRKRGLSPQSGFNLFQTGVDDNTLELGQKVVDAINGLSTSLVAAKVDINHTVPAFDGLMGSFANGFQALSRLDEEVPSLKYVLGCLCAYGLWHDTKNVVYKSIGCALVTFVAIKFGAQLPELMEQLSHLGDESDQIRPQSGVHGVPLAEMVLSYMYLCVFRKTAKDNVIETFVKGCADMPKVYSGLQFTLDQVTKLFQRAADFITSSFDIEKFHIRESAFPEVDAYADEVVNLVDSFRKGVPFDYDHGMRVFEVHKRGMMILKTLPGNKETAEYRTAMMQTLSHLKPLVQRFESSNIVGNGPRVEPLGIMLGGASGVGKSTISTMFLLDVMARVLPEDALESFERNHNDHIYNRCVENEYMDGYHDQTVFNFDDIGQHVDVAGVTNNAYMEAIRAINMANWMPHMASLVEKGNVNFRSKIVFATTNRTHFDLKSIHSSEAFTRRWKVSYLQVPKKEYCIPESLVKCDGRNLWDRRLDLTKCVGVFDLDAVEFYRHDFLTGTTSNEAISYQELVDLTVNQFLNSQTKSLSVLALHESYKKKALSLRREGKILARCEEDVFHDAKMIMPQSGFSTDPSCPGDLVIDKLVHLMRNQGVERINLATMLEGLCEIYRLNREDFVDYLAGLEESTDLEKQNQPLEWMHAQMESYHKHRFERVYGKLAEVWHMATDKMGQTARRVRVLGAKAASWARDHERAIKICGWIGLACAMVPIVRLFFFNNVEPAIEAQTPYHLRKENRKRLKPTKGFWKSTKVVEVPPTLQSSFNRASIDACIKVYKKNMYKLTMSNYPGEFGWVLFIRDRLAVMPNHFADQLLDIHDDTNLNTPIICISKDRDRTSIQVEFMDLEFVKVAGTDNDDFIFVNFPRVMPCQADITSYFRKEDEKVLSSPFSGALVIPRGEAIVFPAAKVFPEKDVQYLDYQNAQSFMYNVPTKHGECGAPLFVTDIRQHSPMIAGIHVAGTGDKGYAVRITLENVELAVKYFEPDVTLPMYEHTNVEAQMGDQFTTLFEAKQPFVPKRSRIKPSVLHGKWGPSRVLPARLTKFNNEFGELVDPWALARRKYCFGAPLMNLGLLEMCRDFYIRKCFTNSIWGEPFKPMVFENEIAVAGIPGVRFFQGIPRFTSCGYPLNLSHIGKTDFFGDSDDYTFDSPDCVELFAMVDDIIANAKKGLRMEHIYVDYLKDEKKPKEKVEMGKTRAISAVPLAYLIACRRVFGDFSRWIMQNRIHNMSAIGVNPYSDEWDRLYRLLTVHGGKGIAGDFSHYDGSLCPALMYTVLDFADRFYSGLDYEWSIARRVLFEDCVNSRHLQEGIVYEWMGANPSGTFLTTIINTVCNAIAMTYCMVDILGEEDGGHMEICSNRAYTLLDIIYRDTTIVDYGDDNIVGLSDELSTIITQSSMTTSFAKIGLTYTDENKDKVIRDFRNVTELSFLKRGFRRERLVGRVVAPLELGVILEMPYWTKETMSEEEFSSVLDTTLMELALHGESVYKQWAEKIIIAGASECAYAPKVSGWSANLLKACAAEDWLL